MGFSHPLDPLSIHEISDVVDILRKDKAASPSFRFGTVTLNEPTKESILKFKPGDLIEREAFVVLLDKTTAKTYEAVVSLDSMEVSSFKYMAGVQPAFMLDEFVECEEAVKANPKFKKVIAKRGIVDVSLVMVDPWSAGSYGFEEEEGMRLSRALCWVKSSPSDNGYARPIEGVVVVVDLNKMEVLDVEDHEIVPLPTEDGNYTPEFVSKYREDIKPLSITQPEGPSFEVNGQEISWQKWKMRVGFTPREGLVLYTVSYTDQGEERPILYRASLGEMTVPYGSPKPAHYRKNAFDVGEYNIGALSNSLKLGCDCKGHIHYFDAAMTDSRGAVMTIENAICLHEEDYGILWKHMDWRTEATEVRRSRRLVVSFIATVGNYEYGYYWYFYQDGTIQYEVKLTGMVNTVAVHQGEPQKYGTVIAPGLMAPIHQHIFCVRIDPYIDGTSNSVYEVDVVPEEDDLNPYGNAFYAKATKLKTEKEAQRLIDPMCSRFWKIASSTRKNAMGYPTSFKLLPGENAAFMARPSSSVAGRGVYMNKHLWVTPFNASEKYPTGDYPNQSAPGKGLPEFTVNDRCIEDKDVVLWYTFAHTHAPRAEDWPVMPVGTIGFMLKPYNFFNLNPSNDVPAEKKIGCENKCPSHDVEEKKNEDALSC